jgi:hypothetical protein
VVDETVLVRHVLCRRRWWLLLLLLLLRAIIVRHCGIPPRVPVAAATEGVEHGRRVFRGRHHCGAIDGLVIG